MVTKIPIMRPDNFSLDYKRMTYSLMFTDSYTPMTSATHGGRTMSKDPRLTLL